MLPTKEQAWDLLCEYNEGEFHRLHARIVGDVMRYFAVSLAMRTRQISGRPSASCTIWILNSTPTSTVRRKRRFCAKRAWTSAWSMRS